jgi:3'(2'), 5'-bisphosphate nucleotidase
METSLDAVLLTAMEGGRRAAHVCRAVLAEAPDTPDAMAKLGKEPVTVADYGSQAVILEAVARAFPEHGVISEEGSAHLRESSADGGAGADGETEQVMRITSAALGREVDFEQVCDWIDHDGVEGAEYTWAIDPIDGTKGFLRREQYAVAIGILRNGKPWAGVMVCPNLPVDLDQPDGQRGVMYVAGEGMGTRRIPIDGGPEVGATVSAAANPADWRVLGSVESAHGDPALVLAMMKQAGVGGGFVRYDSQVKYGVVAEGAAEIYVRPRSHPEYRENIWDHAAGVIVCQEAGGRVTDLDGAALDFTLGRKLEQNRGILATAGGEVHEAVLEALRLAAAQESKKENS